MSKDKTIFDLSFAASIGAILVFSFIFATPSRAVEPIPFAASKSDPAAVGGLLRDSALWTAYRTRFLDKTGRIIDTGNGRASHSEGQGYGMLLAVAAADRSSFDAIWSWTKANLLVRQDRLAAWRWNPDTERVEDKNNATDGDVLIAWALAEAANFWDEPLYLSAARAVTDDIIVKTIRVAPGHGNLLMPAARGFSRYERSDGPVVNLSYWVFPAFPRLAQINPEFDGRALTLSGLELLSRARFGAFELPPDWLSLQAGARGAEPAPALGFQSSFGYDAIRIPLYLYWADTAAKDLLPTFARAWAAGTSRAQLIGLGVDGKNVAVAEPGYQAIAALVRCAISNQSYPEEFYRFTSNQNYYPATLHMLSLLAAITRGGTCLNPAAMLTVAPHIGQKTPLSLTSPSSRTARLAGFGAPRSGNAPQLAVSTAIAAIPMQGAMAVDEVESDWLAFYLRCAFGGLAATSALVWAIRKFDRKHLVEKPGEHEEFSYGALSIIPPTNEGSQALVPRTLPHISFTHTSDTAILGRQIECAADACVRLSRTIGVLYFELGSFETLDRELGAEDVDLKVAALISELRRLLRATDYAARLDRNQIVICICLLANSADLRNIANRLRGAIQRHGFGPQPAGHAIYPLNGYIGEELINAAREDYLSQLGEIAPGDFDNSPKQFVSDGTKKLRRRLANRATRQSHRDMSASRGHLTLAPPKTRAELAQRADVPSN
jgi:endoglucanase